MANSLSRFARKTHIQNSSGEGIVLKELGQGDETVWEIESPEARFERESGQIIITQLGSGSFATVFATISDADADRFVAEYNAAKGDSQKIQTVIQKMQACLSAAKVLKQGRAGTAQHVKNLRKEAKLLQYVKDNFSRNGGRKPCVVGIVQDGSGKSDWYIMELVSGGSVDNLRQMFWNPAAVLGHTIPAALLWHMLAQLAETILFLNFGIVDGQRDARLQTMAHGDLHGGNVLFRYPGQFGNYPDVVIADFGLSKLAPPSDATDASKLHFWLEQVGDLQRVCDWLYAFINKADDDLEMLQKAIDKLDWVETSDNNKDLKQALQKLLKTATHRRQKYYKDLSEPWVQYLSQPAVSGDDLEQFLLRYQRLNSPSSSDASSSPAKSGRMTWLADQVGRLFRRK